MAVPVHFRRHASSSSSKRQRTWSARVVPGLLVAIVVAATIARQTNYNTALQVSVTTRTTLVSDCSLSVGDKPSRGCAGDIVVSSSRPTATEYCEQIRDTCTRIQCQSWSGSWNSVDERAKKEWYDMDCRTKLRKQALLEPIKGPNCTANDKTENSHERISSLQDKYKKNGKCVLIGNGPSLNEMRWDWQDHFDVVMGTNKIYLGLERYNITTLNYYASCNWLVIRQSREEIWGGLHGTEKFLRKVPHLFPCSATEKGIHYVNKTSIEFSTDPRLGLNEGYTVTYWSLQVLYFVGCKEVYLIGVDHNFQQVITSCMI